MENMLKCHQSAIITQRACYCNCLHTQVQVRTVYCFLHKGLFAKSRGVSIA